MARVHGFIGCEKYHSMKVVASQLVHLCTISVLHEWCGKSDFFAKEEDGQIFVLQVVARRLMKMSI